MFQAEETHLYSSMVSLEISELAESDGIWGTSFSVVRDMKKLTKERIDVPHMPHVPLTADLYNKTLTSPWSSVARAHVYVNSKKFYPVSVRGVFSYDGVA